MSGGGRHAQIETRGSSEAEGGWQTSLTDTRSDRFVPAAGGFHFISSEPQTSLSALLTAHTQQLTNRQTGRLLTY